MGFAKKPESKARVVQQLAHYGLGMNEEGRNKKQPCDVVRHGRGEQTTGRRGGGLAGEEGPERKRVGK